jgi:hypothetical protein
VFDNSAAKFYSAWLKIAPKQKEKGITLNCQNIFLAIVIFIQKIRMMAAESVGVENNRGCYGKIDNA